ncbi:hypothetical protein BJX68DRAFT_261041 [Aspergillus pseudodeflectus]|uniref:Uncharacterized protein n=1 Tax=Aspergillus pseudodeflectus TaxID=176178 RepID=A0ABR4L6G9_9EURO
MPVYSLIIHTNTSRYTRVPGCGILITPDQETGDLLYRYRQTPPKGENFTELTKLERPSKQVWQMRSNGDSIYARVDKMNHPDFVMDDDCFACRPGNIYVYGTGEFPSIPLIPHDSSPAPLNRGEFLIRRKGFPDFYWSYRDFDSRIVIRDRPTVFRIELVDSKVGTETVGTPILIASDKVYITAVTATGEHKVSYTVLDDDVWCRGDLKASEARTAASVFTFGALHRGFTSSGGYVKDCQGKDLAAEDWELVV